MTVYPFLAEISKHKLNMSYLHHSERFREKIHFFILSGECLASLFFVQSSVQKLLLAWVPWGSLYSSPAGGGGSHSLYSLGADCGVRSLTPRFFAVF